MAIITPMAMSQTAKKRYNGWTLGLHGEHMTFHGDIRQYDWWPAAGERVNFGGGVTVGYQINHVFGVNLNLLYGGLGGIHRAKVGEAASPSADVRFSATVIDYTVNGTFNIVNLIYSDRTKDRWFSAYLTGGIGFVSFWSLKQDLYTDAYEGSTGYNVPGGDVTLAEKKAPTTETVIPVGIGLKFRLTKRLHLNLESTFRFTVTEKLDATQGSTGVNDHYSTLGLGLTYTFGKHEDSKEWVNPFEALNKNMEDIQANIDGLAQDGDGDGVSDLFDKEEATPADISVDGSGRALDSDGDGVPDHLDVEPFSNKGARVDENGKELDSDADGVADSQDIEPNTAAGSMVNFQGKAIDINEIEGGSTSTVNVSGGGLHSIYFKVNSSRIDYWSSYDRLAEVAKVMKASAEVKMKVVGHADKTGTEDYNDKLADKRAQAAIDHLVNIYGIDAGRFTKGSSGEAEPLSSADEALNVNRRVDFTVQ
ncbi:MAG: OOP family OmpA-OmpF porin [Oceanospirillaceae bacterium]|jgi:OOP family OmpA-OmpF porin